MVWTSDQVVAVLEHLGFSLARRESHDTFTKPGHPRTVSVPRNRKSVAPNTLSSIWRQAGIDNAQAREIRKRLAP
jgi:predicted RNA binding protein YcfA (HicA-like mRNA interferase family)